MRCPYCGGINQDTVTFCRYCGRDLSKADNTLLASQSARPQKPAQRPTYPAPQSPYPVAPARVPPPAQRGPTSTVARPRVAAVSAPPQVPVVPATLVAPAAPEDFPPRTVAQLRALEQGALNYTLVSDDEQVGNKRVVCVAYPSCSGWQQMATLYKVWLECREDNNKAFNTVIIRGVRDANTSAYSFNNGQLVFDRSVRLGSDLLNRFQIETGDGFASDAIRVVLTEVVA